MDKFTDLRRQCAEAIGYVLFAQRPETGDVIIKYTPPGRFIDNFTWQPDKDDSQLVECIEWLRKHGGAQHQEHANWIYAMYAKNWREAIMRAVVAVGEK